MKPSLQAMTVAGAESKNDEPLFRPDMVRKTVKTKIGDQRTSLDVIVKLSGRESKDRIVGKTTPLKICDRSANNLAFGPKLGEGQE